LLNKQDTVPPVDAVPAAAFHPQRAAAGDQSSPTAGVTETLAWRATGGPSLPACFRYRWPAFVPDADQVAPRPKVVTKPADAVLSPNPEGDFSERVPGSSKRPTTPSAAFSLVERNPAPLPPERRFLC
jgi:hypothetical protein